MANHGVNSDDDVRSKDKGMENAWHWDWLEKHVEGDNVECFIDKVRVRGMAQWELGSKVVVYTS